MTSSYHRCLSSEKFIDTFYKFFLAKSEEVAQKFIATDFDHQKLMLRESLLMMVMFSRDPVGVRDEMAKLAKRHDRTGVDIPARLYALWLDSLCEAVQEHDPEFSEDVGHKWRAAMEPGIDFIISKH
ncbi:globin [Adhaeretor mobilis]|uniref:globin n=1 Tax=Adhaeretor mobilis TaxID=1930276 RepID=UPI001C54EC49|nr:globin [Adhaeretor mobilis]